MSKLGKILRSKSGLTGLAIAAALSFGLGGTARATPIFFDMDLTGTSGSFDTMLGTGSFSIDSSQYTGIGSEEFGPVGGAILTPGLLSFDFAFAGTSWTMSEDISYPDYPGVSFLDGVFVGYDYFSDSGFESFNIGSGDGTGFDYNDADDGTTDGFVSTTVSVVPIPAALPLFFSGLVGLGLVGRKRRKRYAEAESGGLA